MSGGHSRALDGSIYILHVDDDPSQLELVKIYLRLLDPQIVVDSVSSPTTAIEMLREKEYDCVVSDYVMSEMNGIRFAIYVREQNDVPFILYTGQGSEEVAQDAFEAGIDDYIRKELEKSTFQVLAKRIRVAVGKHRAEEALRLREEQYRKIVDTSPDAIIMTDLGGKIIATNRQAAHLHGYDVEEEFIASGLTTFDLVAPEDRQRALQNTQKTVKDGFIRNVEYNLLKKDGTAFPAELNASVILGDSGEPTAFIAVVRDITSRKDYQNRLEVLHEHTSKLKGVTSIGEVAELTLNAIEQVLGFQLGNFSVIEGDVLKEIHTRGFELDEDYLLPLDGQGVSIRAIHTGMTQLVPDVRLDEDYLIGPVEGYYDPLSELVVPVKINERVIAVINVESEKLNAFTRDDQKLLEILAGYVASTIFNIQLLDAERNYKTKIEALHSSSTQLVLAQNNEEVFDIALNVIQGVLGFHWGGIGVVRDRGIKYVRMIGAEIPSDAIMPLDGAGITVRTVRTGRSQLIHDTRLDPDYVQLSDTQLGASQNLSEVVVPILLSNRVEAVLNLENEKPGAFSEDDLRLLETLAQHIGSALGRLQELEALKGSEQKFKGFLESSLDTVIVNVGTKIEYVNQKLVDLLGYDSPSELIGRGISKLFPPEIRDEITERTIRRQLGEDEPDIYETAFLSRDGTTVDIEVVLSVIEYDGQPATLGFARDITERKRFERKLDTLHRHALELAKAESEEDIAEATLNAIEKIFGFNYVSFALVDGDLLRFKYVRGVSTIKELHLKGRGLTVKAINTREIQNIPDTRISENYLSSRTDGEPESLSELDVPIFVDGKAIALLNIESEKIDAFSASDRDLVETLSMHVSSAFMRLSEVNRLESLVEEKTMELLEAERVVAAGRIASMVGHDLRGPLQTIEAAVGLMKEDPSETLALTDIIRTSVKRATEMLEEIRSHIRDTPLLLIRTNLIELVKKVLDENVFPDNIAVSLKAQSDYVPVQVDLNKTRRVIDNLIQNAVDAMPHGGELRVQISEDGESSTLIIEDTGEGIPDKILPDLFNLFVTTKSKGTGLGLAYCRRTVMAHGGSITVKTEVGQGTAFTVRLPKPGEDDPVTVEPQLSAPIKQ